MKKTLLIFFGLLLTLIHQSRGQQATFTIDVTSPKNNTIILYTTGINTALPISSPHTFDLINKRLSKTFDLPQITQFYVMGTSNTNWRQRIYISPGDNMHLQVDSKDGKDHFKISGKGSENNQPFDFPLYVAFDQYKQDSLPDRILTAIQKHTDSLSRETKRYIAHSKPTTTFRNTLQYDLTYAPIHWFFNFYGNHKFYLRKLSNGEQLMSTWQQKSDSLLTSAPLNNENALISSFYKMLMQNYLDRKKEDLWNISRSDSFLSAYYPEFPPEKRASIFASDPENLLREKIINNEFTGKVNEYLYAYLLQTISESQKTNATAIYDRFKAKYPSSTYLSLYEPFIAEARINEKRQLNEKMVLIDSSSTLKRLEEVVNLFKGKTVLVDMWGTWCSPCHEEIEKNSAHLKEHFKNKDLVFLYVSNYDLNNKTNWKKLMSYYNLEGKHILAAQELSEDIISKVGGKGYPTYFIIKKDGTYELSKAGYPMKRDLLIKQVEEALQ